MLSEELKQIYQDSRFIRRKKVFSQSKRPPKTIWVPPKFIISSEANSEKTLTKIRDDSISVEGLCFEKNNKWHKKEMSPLRSGCNYYVNPDDIRKTLIKVCNAERLQTDTPLHLMNSLKTDIQQLMSTNEIRSNLTRALSLAVWFCERVKQIKRY